MESNVYYILFSFNIPVRGNGKSVIYNLQKSKLIFVPDVMIDFIESLKLYPISYVKQHIDIDSLSHFDNYMEFLDQNQLGFYSTTKDEFPELKLDWKAPNSIISCIIEFDCIYSDFQIDLILNQIESLNCFHIEFIIKNTDISFLKKLGDHTLYMTIKSMNFYIEYTVGVLDFITTFYEENEKIEYILIYNTDSRIEFTNTDRIVFIKNDIENEQFKIYKDQYVVNVKYFTESFSFHPFFNRKICIDHKGYVKNDLSFDTCFGNVKNSPISAILDSTDIKDLWHACPDKVLDYKNDILRYCAVYTDDLVKLDNGYYRVR